MSDPCIFCEIIAGRSPAEWIHNDPAPIRSEAMASVVAFKPLNPVVEGHVLVVPRQHFEDALSMPYVTGDVFEAAATIASDLDWDGHWNFITSRGKHATQSVFHLHVHLVPRRENDGLALPWYSGKVKR